MGSLKWQIFPVPCSTGLRNRSVFHMLKQSFKKKRIKKKLFFLFDLKEKKNLGIFMC